MKQTDRLDAVQEGAAILHRWPGFFYCNFLYHGMQRNRTPIQRLHKAFFNQIIDRIHIPQVQPVCKQSGRNAGQRSQGKISHKLCFRIGQLIQRKQRMDMVIIGGLAASAVLGDTDGISRIQGGFFFFQFL